MAITRSAAKKQAASTSTRSDSKKVTKPARPAAKGKSKSKSATVKKPKSSNRKRPSTGKNENSKAKKPSVNREKKPSVNNVKKPLASNVKKPPASKQPSARKPKSKTNKKTPTVPNEQRRETLRITELASPKMTRRQAQLHKPLADLSSSDSEDEIDSKLFVQSKSGNGPRIALSPRRTSPSKVSPKKSPIKMATPTKPSKLSSPTRVARAASPARSPVKSQEYMTRRVILPSSASSLSPTKSSRSRRLPRHVSGLAKYHHLLLINV